MDTQSLFSLEGRTALVRGLPRYRKNDRRWLYRSGCQGLYLQSQGGGVRGGRQRAGPNCIAVPQDISTVEGCKALAATMAEHEDCIDILVNNMERQGESFESHPEEGWIKS